MHRSRIRTLPTLLCVLLLLVAGMGSLGHVHEDAGQQCRLCHNVEAPDPPASEASLHAVPTETSPVVAVTAPRPDDDDRRSSVLLRGPPAGSLTA